MAMTRTSLSLQVFHKHPLIHSSIHRIHGLSTTHDISSPLPEVQEDRAYAHHRRRSTALLASNPSFITVIIINRLHFIPSLRSPPSLATPPPASASAPFPSARDKPDQSLALAPNRSRPHLSDIVPPRTASPIIVVTITFRLTFFHTPHNATMLRLLSTILGAATVLAGVSAQQTSYGIGVPNNVTSLQGTWSSGAGHVVTGLNFYDPVNNSFIYPATAGQSYSFTDDGFWEQALYLYNVNPAKPNCVSAQLIWQHGTYTLNSNNSLTLNIFKGDGRQQISDRCAERSNYVQSYDQVEFMQGFVIHQDEHFGASTYALQLYQFDGSLKPMLFQVYDPPQMLPTQALHEQVIGELNSS